MAARKNKGKYEVCQECGAHLDHGEQCDCEEERKTHMACECAKPDYAVDEPCPLDTQEVEHCEECYWARILYD